MTTPEEQRAADYRDQRRRRRAFDLAVLVPAVRGSASAYRALVDRTKAIAGPRDRKHTKGHTP